MLDNNMAKGLTNINKGVRFSTKHHSSTMLNNASLVLYVTVSLTWANGCERLAKEEAKSPDARVGW